MANSTPNPATTWVTGPASAIAASAPPESGRGLVYDAYPARKSREISAVAPARRAATAWPSSWSSVKAAIEAASHTPNSSPYRKTISSMKNRNPRRTWTGNPSTRIRHPMVRVVE